ncbi:DUF6541 family protein [Senegalimassilia anaerobia]|uniref:DUF6541 family protein n=1 Tax=Senegalimassilia anaerobia TaxID=1473216 RepID=UPI00265F59B4|nr:DUF6541 family protein [Senegalimassilia anaerobia]
MWLTFALAICLGVVVLYVPGYLVGRAVSLERFASVAVAPAFSVAALVILGVVLNAAHVRCDGWMLLLVCAALCLLIYGVCRVLRGLRGVDGRTHLTRNVVDGEWVLVALYIGVAAAVSLVVFVHAMGDPVSFSRNDDTTVHLSVVRGFLDSGTFSTLNVTKYLDLGESGGYYPAAWHVVTAVVASLVGNQVALATNAMILVVCVFVLPVGLLFLLRQLFPDNKLALYAGSLFSVAFCGYPWGFVVFGQLLSNLLSFALIPGALGLLISSLNASGPSKSGFAVAYACSMISVALAQPNGAFTLGMWSVAFAVSHLWSKRSDGYWSGKRTAIILCFIACAAWVLLFVAPPLQGVVTYSWKPALSIPKAIVAGLLFMFTNREGVQPFLTVLVLLGIAKTLKDRRLRWLSVSYIAAFSFYVIDVATDGFVKQLLTGFWYTDYYRTGAMIALFAVPLAALGFAWLVKLGTGLLGKMRFGRQGSNDSCVVAMVLVVLLAVCQFAPVRFAFGKTDVRPGLMKIHAEVSSRYSWEKGLTSEEDAFVKRVMSLAGHDCVINVPSDGSCWSYGVEGINTMFRRSATAGPSGSEPYATVLRTQLCDYAVSDEVREAVEKTGAHYVMLLDEKSYNDRTVVKLRYKEEDWVGIESITQDTPGFTLVLSEGDMRLYRIR